MELHTRTRTYFARANIILYDSLHTEKLSLSCKAKSRQLNSIFMKRITLLISFVTFAIATAMAIPAKQGIYTHRQSDGTVITYEVFGDEFNNYTLADGLYTIVQDESGDFCYALTKNGHMVSSGVKVRPTSRLSAREKEIAQQSIGVRNTAYNPLFNRDQHSPETMMMRAAEQMKAAAAPHEEALRLGGWGGEVKGNRNLLVILVEYSDIKFSIDNVQQRFTNMLNSEGYSDNGATGSAKDFFKASSSNKFVPTFDVVGPYTLSGKRADYGGNVGGEDKAPAVQAMEACQLADGSVDFSKYDANGDGNIDLVFILYAGHNPAEGGPADAVWPHKWELYPGYNIIEKDYPRFDGKKLVEYACTSELRGYSGKNMTNIGTFCHEFGHALGLPDWYDVDYNGGFGMSYASIMNSGSYLNDSATPPTHNALERWLLGWTLPKELAVGSYEVQHVSKNDTYIIWANDRKTECFLFEARTKGANFHWDYYLNYGDSRVNYEGGEGMLVYHVDWTGSYLDKWKTHTINTDPEHQCAYIFRANPGATEKNSKGRFFPGSRNVTTLSYDTAPQFKNWSLERLKLELQNIAIYNDVVGFDVVSKDFEMDTRQYDALLDWRASAENSSAWIVKFTEKESGEERVIETTNKYAVITPLKCDTRYHAQIFKVSNTDEPLYEAEIHTQSSGITPRPALMLNSEYKKSDDIRLSVKNLDGNPANIEWYVDRNKVTDLMFSLPAGQHHICAVITDEQGNTSYLYRYITVK